MKKPNISIIVPVYNEENSAGKVISGIISQMSNIDIDYEIIAINDGSIDNSLKTLEKFSEIKVINHPRNMGYGAALKTGIKNSQYDWILIIDADGSYPVNAINQLVASANTYDLVIGTRDEHSASIPLQRRHAKRFLNRFASYLVGKKIPDLNSGLRIFKKEIVLKYWELFPNKFSFTSTLTMVCLTHNYETKFIPIDYYKREGKSSIKPTDFFNFLKLILKLSLFFKPIKVFTPISGVILLGALGVAMVYFTGITSIFFDTTFIILCTTALQTFFFGLLAEIIVHNK